jgi:hypothetical protein
MPSVASALCKQGKICFHHLGDPKETSGTHGHHSNLYNWTGGFTLGNLAGHTYDFDSKRSHLDMGF